VIRDALQTLADLSLLEWTIAALATFGLAWLVGATAACVVKLWRRR
jgi:hypothetical protein